MKATATQISDLLEQASPPLPTLTPPQNPENPLSEKERTNQDISMKTGPSAKPKPRKRSIVTEQEIISKKKCKSEKKPDHKQRFNDVKHLPIIEKNRLVRCKKEGCEGKSYIFCSDCKIHLCLNIPKNRNCFKDFHEL